MATKVTSEFNTQTSGINERHLADTLPDVSPHHTTDSPKRIRLLVGEGDFSFATALLERHKFSGDIIIATEIRQRDELIEMHGNQMEETLSNLQELGVELMFGVDATKLHERFQHVHRIYFNFPYTSTRVTRNEPSDTARMLKEFFASAAKVQEIGDRILLTLVYKDDQEGQEWWHGHLYGIEAAAHTNRYELVGKRRFSHPDKGNRYSSYTHRETNRSNSSKNWENARQYVFERVVDSSQFKSRTKRGRINYMDVTYFKDMETNNDTDTDSDIPSPHTTDSVLHGTSVQEKKLHLLKWALGYQLTPDNEDRLEHNVARVLFLHTFDLDLNDVADAIEAENEIEWSNKRITKDLIVATLRCNLKQLQEKNTKLTTDDWWFCSDELCALQALNTFDIALVDLRQYFKYEDTLLDSLKYDGNSIDDPTDKGLISNEDDPTWTTSKMWRRQVIDTPGADNAIETEANNNDSWDVRKDYPTGFFVRIRAQGGNRVIAVSTRDKNRRIIVFAGNHDNYVYYLNYTTKMINRNFNASPEKRQNPDMILFDYIFSENHKQIPF